VSLTLPPRWQAMLLGWGCVGPVYHTLGALPRAAWVVPETALDRAIAFDPAGVWLYLSFFALVPCAYFACPPQRLRWLMHAFQLCALACLLIFLAWPSTLVYPPLPADGIDSEALRLLIGIDSPLNCLPSLHGALGLLAVAALWERERPWRSTAFALWGLLIFHATIETRRHLVIDLGAGLALGAAAAWLSRYLLHRRMQ
jgi:hypothetical protein